MRSRLAALAVLAALAAVPAALGDGDPASDYLLGQSTFLSPYDGHIPAAGGNELIALLASAKKRGFSLKVAVIVTGYDLGAVPILFDKPHLYAKFLGTEDYYYWRDELLVVMPNGYGLFKAKHLPAADTAVIAKLPALHTRSGAALVAAAETAVRALAARRGITLSAVPAATGRSSATRDRLEIGGAVLLAALLALGARVVWRRRRPPGRMSA
jgi:hypothetical protein